MNKTLDEIFDEIKDDPDASERIWNLYVLWECDYDIIRNLPVISDKETTKMTYKEYMEGVDKEIDELKRRLEEYNERKT